MENKSILDINYEKFCELASESGNCGMYECETVITNNIFWGLVLDGDIKQEEYYLYESRLLDYLLSIIKGNQIYAEVITYDKQIRAISKCKSRYKWEPEVWDDIHRMSNNNKFGKQTLFSREELKTILLIGIRELGGINVLVWSVEDDFVLLSSNDMDVLIYCNNVKAREMIEKYAKKHEIYLYNYKEENELKNYVSTHNFAKAAELVDGLHDSTLEVMMFNIYYDFGISDDVTEFIEYMKKEKDNGYWQRILDLIKDNPYPWL